MVEYKGKLVVKRPRTVDKSRVISVGSDVANNIAVPVLLSEPVPTTTASSIPNPKALARVASSCEYVYCPTKAANTPGSSTCSKIIDEPAPDSIRTCENIECQEKSAYAAASGGFVPAVPANFNLKLTLVLRAPSTKFPAIGILISVPAVLKVFPLTALKRLLVARTSRQISGGTDIDSFILSGISGRETIP